MSVSNADQNDTKAESQEAKDAKASQGPFPCAHKFPTKKDHAGQGQDKEKPARPGVFIQFQYSARQEADHNRNDPSENAHVLFSLH